MTYLDLVVSGFLFGLTSLWPISGNVVVEKILATFQDPTITPIVILICSQTVGLALLVVLRHEISAIVSSAIAASKRRQEGSFRLLIAFILGSLPIGLVDGFDLHWATDLPWLSTAIVLVSGLLVLMADKLGVTVRDINHVSAFNFLIIGLAQGAAQIFGLAASIVAIILARLMGCERQQAARIAMLLIIPHLLLGTGRVFHPVTLPPSVEVLFLATMTLVGGIIGAYFLLFWLKRRTFALFTLMQWLLGFALAFQVLWPWGKVQTF